MTVAAHPMPPPGTAAVPSDPVWRLSVDQYHQMIDSGILTDDDPVELLEGWLVIKEPRHPSHRLATRRIRESVGRLLPPEWFVDTREPITTLDSEPEPDVTVVRGRRRGYSTRHPGPEDLALVVEVADASLCRDRSSTKRI